MIDYDTRKALDDIAFDLQWVATYIEDIEIMREKNPRPCGIYP